MPRSHPPTLLSLIQRLCREASLFAPNERVLLAVSGGIDSMAMLHAMGLLRRKLGLTLFSCGVDHGLRPEARAELEVAESFAREHEIPFARVDLTVEPGGNLQARARAARYEALENVARELRATTIATAHHADDRAETVLLRLLRGCSVAGLGVLPARSGRRVRPLLLARRQDIVAHVVRHKVPFSTDPSNRNPRFLRARVRHELLPLMESIGPGVIDGLNALADEVVSLRAEEGHTAISETLGLARGTREGLRKLKAHGARKSEVWLPGGLAAGFDRAHSCVTIRSGTRARPKD